MYVYNSHCSHYMSVSGLLDIAIVPRHEGCKPDT